MSLGTVAIAGAGGFLGRALLRRLAAAGVELRLHAGPPGCLDAAALPGAVAFAIDDGVAVAGFLRGLGPKDCVVHLAGPPDIRASVRDPAQCLRDHISGTAAVLAAAAAAGCAVVHVSSDAVYGAGRWARFQSEVPEETPLQPESPYAAAKRAAEEVVRAYATVLPGLILRPANVYGPGAHPTTLIPELVGQALAGSPVRARQPEAPFDPIHVDDVSAALESAIRRVRTLPSGIAIDVGSGGWVRAGDLALRIARLAQGGSPEPAPGPGEARGRRASSLLGFTPAVGLDAGLVGCLTAASVGDFRNVGGRPECAS